MRDDDDNVLADYDLSAWEAPAPRAGLADAVIARAKQPLAVAAVDPEPKPANKRWWIAGGVAVALAAGIGIAAFGIEPGPRDGGGDVVAAHAQSLELGPSNARLDQGTEVHWRRAKHAITIKQPRGAATWTIGGDDTALIDAGAMVASVEASGASLRVEVQMNLSDARAIGTSAVTAAVVAMVTIIVYEGRVKVTHGGQTVNVEPGATLELRGTIPPPDPVVGLQQQLDDKDRQIRELQAMIEEHQTKSAGPPPVAKTVCDFDALVQKGDEQFNIGLHAAALYSWEQASACKSDQAVIRKIVMAACNSKNVPKAKQYFPKVTGTGQSGVRQICVRNGIDLDGGCDADALKQKGDDHLQNGMDAAALAAFEASMKCRPDDSLLRYAFMASCRSKNVAKARYYFGRLPASTSSSISMICTRNGVDLGRAPATTAGDACDADALRQKGDDHLQTGMDAAALAAFEASMRCKPDETLIRFAALAACRSKNTSKARLYISKLPSTTAEGIRQVCIRNSVVVDDDRLASLPDQGTLKLASKPPARIAIDGVDTGETTPAVIKLAPGKHKVTYTVGDDKFTWSVTIAAGETTTMVKDLQ